MESVWKTRGCLRGSRNPGLSFGAREERGTPITPMPPYSPNPIPSFAHSLGGWGEPGLARRVPSNDTHYAGVWQLRGRREPQGLRSHGTRPAHPGPFLVLYESGAQGRRAGWGEELAWGQLEPGERKEHWGVWVPRVGVEAGGAGVARCVRVCVHICAGVFRPTGSLCVIQVFF